MNQPKKPVKRDRPVQYGISLSPSRSDLIVLLGIVVAVGGFWVALVWNHDMTKGGVQTGDIHPERKCQCR